MRSLLLISMVATLASLAASQRPWYAGSKPIGYPELASRFEPTTPDAASPTTASVGLGNRVDVNEGPTPSTTTEYIPVDALGQKELIDRIKTWPREKWPYWYLNYLAIEEHRKNRPNQPAGNANAQPINQQASGTQDVNRQQGMGASSNNQQRPQGSVAGNQQGVNSQLRPQAGQQSWNRPQASQGVARPQTGTNNNWNSQDGSWNNQRWTDNNQQRNAQAGRQQRV